jgi:predicted nucleotide-binding protein
MELQSATRQLIGRLRDLEATLLGLSDIGLAIEFTEASVLYDQRLQQLEASHSQSWFGDHAETYYAGFAAPPGGNSFDVEWGFVPGFSSGRNRGWHTYSRAELRDFILDGIGERIFFAWHELEQRLVSEFAIVRDQTLDTIEALIPQVKAKALARYQTRIESQLTPYTAADFVNARLKSAPRMTRDSEEIAKGQHVPIHVQYMASIQSAENNKKRAGELASTIRNIIEASLLHMSAKPEPKMGTRLFLGHGRSDQWMTLRDFVRDRLHLDFDEFNRLPVAGISNKERLSEMLDNCGFALLVMTGEDEHVDGTQHARENVIHEIGLFQGRIGWRKAIVLIEDGCREFSNIAGLGQVRYAKGNIASCFEEIRRILEREEVITPHSA